MSRIIYGGNDRSGSDIMFSFSEKLFDENGLSLWFFIFCAHLTLLSLNFIKIFSHGKLKIFFGPTKFLFW